MEFDFKHADNIWLFQTKFILSENSKTNFSFLWVRGFSSPDWWLSLSFEAIPHYQSANLCKESSTHNTAKELRSAAADEEKDKCIFKTSCVLLKSKQTPSLWLFWARGGGSCRSVEATWNSGGWRSNQLVCIAMRHWLCQPAKSHKCFLPTSNCNRCASGSIPRMTMRCHMDNCQTDKFHKFVLTSFKCNKCENISNHI